MKELRPLRFDPVTCRNELEELRGMLASGTDVAERSELLPFFRRSVQLSAYIGVYSPQITHSDLVAHEYSLFGDFTCDLVVGDSRRRAYCFVEFENAAVDSIFTLRGTRHAPAWSRRFEQGFSQLVDWFWKLHDARGSTEFLHRFGATFPRVTGLLVIGRSTAMEVREQERLQWRADRVLVDSRPILCITYDQLLADLGERLASYHPVW